MGTSHYRTGCFCLVHDDADAPPRMKYLCRSLERRAPRIDSNDAGAILLTCSDKANSSVVVAECYFCTTIHNHSFLLFPCLQSCWHLLTFLIFLFLSFFFCSACAAFLCNAGSLSFRLILRSPTFRHSLDNTDISIVSS